MDSDAMAALGELKGRMTAVEARQDRMDESSTEELRQLRTEITNSNAAIFKKMEELANAAARRQGSDSALRMIGAVVVSLISAAIGAFGSTIGGHYWPTR